MAQCLACSSSDVVREGVGDEVSSVNTLSLTVIQTKVKHSIFTLRALGSHWRTLSKERCSLTQYCLRCGSSVSNHSGSTTWELVKGPRAVPGPTCQNLQGKGPGICFTSSSGDSDEYNDLRSSSPAYIFKTYLWLPCGGQTIRKAKGRQGEQLGSR